LTFAVCSGKIGKIYNGSSEYIVNCRGGCGIETKPKRVGGELLCVARNNLHKFKWRNVMKTKILIGILVSFLVISVVAVGLVAAKSDNPGQGERPAQAGRPEKLEQIIFVHPVAPEKPGKPDKPPGKPPKDEEPPEEPPKDNTYYELWAKLAPGTATYYVNDDVRLVTGGDPVDAVNAAAEAWDGVTADELFSYGGTTTKSWYAEDEENTVSWVKFLPRDNIAVAVMWYDPATMIIYEVDIVFNTFHNWGIDPSRRDRAFDIQNIATHEFGHPTGLDDLYDEIYSELTMYGYSSKGETQKRTLEEGDKAGARELYGAP